MKIVSFKIAKAIKEAGYPQEYSIGDSWCYENGQYPDESECENPPLSGWVLLPYYLDVWLWLWQEKQIFINVNTWTYGHTDASIDNIVRIYMNNPEEAIIAVIEYMVDNDLIK